MAKSQDTKKETRGFETEAKQLLHLMKPQILEKSDLLIFQHPVKFLFIQLLENT